MRTRLLWFVALALTTFGGTAGRCPADQPRGNAADKEAIAKNAEGFIEAFHKGDAEALTAFWTPDGDYTDEDGKTLKGRAAIAKAFKKFFAENKGLQLRIDSTSLRFVTPYVAVEDGTTAVIPPEAARRAGPATPSFTSRKTATGC
jgi:uncharacterized protein (TIGR02246 family)